ncbi:hypothetical protein J3E64_002614 [Sphingobium sp. OAS761]|uniref:hypothetical protein n=1 Tax=Sphingobium sp. OAS761 TaxID=2817901 RepID=UPI0020A12148|nr:hypothetical protein [Sphingobium sp. OAS761]MCP1470917.1 hypothetical protein [Sphingobium sp. OAS761]
MFHSILLLLAASADQPVQWAQLTIEQRVIIRVPMARQGKAPARITPDSQDDWEERKGPRCIALRSIRAASIVTRDGIDLILADRHRYRARLEKGCDSAGYYSGFYVEPAEDGSLCSGRDELQARSGASCEIVSFRRLVEAEDGD